VPAQNLKPTYVALKKEAEIVAGATISVIFIHSKIGITIQAAVLNDLFLDLAKFNNKKEASMAMHYLISYIIKAATQRRASLLMFGCPVNDRFMSSCFKNMGFLSIPGGVFMVKAFNDSELERISKPLFVSTLDMLGVP